LRSLETAIDRLIVADGVKIHKDRTVSKFEQRSGKMGQQLVKVEFDVCAPGSQFKEKAEAEYDLVVISDGYLSKARELAFPNETVMGATSMRYDAMVKRPSSIPAGLMLDMWFVPRNIQTCRYS
jgi:2-polyprenyl-6-methoxyphenol hydroxylase-like FAD-dependent oxidoreductase